MILNNTALDLNNKITFDITKLTTANSSLSSIPSLSMSLSSQTYNIHSNQVRSILSIKSVLFIYRINYSWFAFNTFSRETDNLAIF